MATFWNFLSNFISPEFSFIQQWPSYRCLTRQSFSSERRSASSDIQKGHVAVNVRENEKKRIVIPVSYLNHYSFQEFLFRVHRPIGGLTLLAVRSYRQCHL